MLSYAPIVVSLIAGLLAFFFAKDGERNKVGGVGWLMAGLLVVGALVSLFTIYGSTRKTAAAEEKRKAAEERTAAADRKAKEQEARAEGLKKSLALMQNASIDSKQRVQDGNFYFEFAAIEDGGYEKSPAGFVGPLPLLPSGVVGNVVVGLEDEGFAQYEFRQHVGRVIQIVDAGRGRRSLLSERSVEPVADGQASGDADGNFMWSAGPEPAPGGFTYALKLPFNVQLRRIVHKLSTAANFGHIRFARGALNKTQLATVESGLAKLTPTYVFLAGEGGTDDPCNSYVRVPLKIRRDENFRWDGKVYDAFTFQLTEEAFKVETCENNPF